MGRRTGAFILLLSLLWLLPRPLNGQVGKGLPMGDGTDVEETDREMKGRSSWTPSSLLEVQIRTEIGRRWGVEPDKLHLEWGELRERENTDEAFVPRLIGNGSGGNWIVAFVPKKGGISGFRAWLRAGVEVEELIAAHDLERGEILSESDITTTRSIRWGRPRKGEELDPLGWTVQRRIGAGETLRRPLIAPPPAVRSGEWVEVRWKGPGLTLTLRAKAERTASVGERLHVRTETGQRLEGIAGPNGTVEIDTPPEVMS